MPYPDPYEREPSARERLCLLWNIVQAMLFAAFTVYVMVVLYKALVPESETKVQCQSNTSAPAKPVSDKKS